MRPPLAAASRCVDPTLGANPAMVENILRTPHRPAGDRAGETSPRCFETALVGLASWDA